MTDLSREGRDRVHTHHMQQAALFRLEHAIRGCLLDGMSRESLIKAVERTLGEAFGAAATEQRP